MVTIMNMEQAATRTLSLIVTQNNVPSDGMTQNIIQATVKEGTALVSGANITFTVTGSALFTNGSNSIQAISNAFGQATVALTDKTGETVTVTATTPSANAATAELVFSGPTINYEISLTNDVNNSAANGTSFNVVEANIQNIETNEPVEGESITFTVTGNALFSNGQKEIIAFSDQSGECEVSFSDNEVETVTVTASNLHAEKASISSTFSDGLTASPQTQIPEYYYAQIVGIDEFVEETGITFSGGEEPYQVKFGDEEDTVPTTNNLGSYSQDIIATDSSNPPQSITVTAKYRIIYAPLYLAGQVTVPTYQVDQSVSYATLYFNSHIYLTGGIPPFVVDEPEDSIDTSKAGTFTATITVFDNDAGQDDTNPNYPVQSASRNATYKVV